MIASNHVRSLLQAEAVHAVVTALQRKQARP